MRKLVLCLVLIFMSSSVLAQAGKGRAGGSNFRKPAQEADAYKFAPPPPPPLDPPEYDELEDEEFDEGFRPPPIPPGGAQPPIQSQPPPPPSPPPPDYRSTNNAYLGPGKFRFQVVDGEYHKKGKKRSRGRKILGQSSGN